jgi:hypothetical protein
MDLLLHNAVKPRILEELQVPIQVRAGVMAVLVVLMVLLTLPITEGVEEAPEVMPVLEVMEVVLHAFKELQVQAAPEAEAVLVVHEAQEVVE